MSCSSAARVAAATYTHLKLGIDSLAGAAAALLIGLSWHRVALNKCMSNQQ